MNFFDRNELREMSNACHNIRMEPERRTLRAYIENEVFEAAARGKTSTYVIIPMSHYKEINCYFELTELVAEFKKNGIVAKCGKTEKENELFISIDWGSDKLVEEGEEEED